MTKAATRQKANNTNANSGKKANVDAATPAAVKPASAKATAAAAQAVKATATVAAAPTREVQSAGKGATKNGNAGKNANANANPKVNANTNNAAATANKNVNANTKTANTAAKPNANANTAAKPNVNASKPASANDSKTVTKKTNANQNNTAKSNKSKQLDMNTVGTSFVLRLVLGLAPEKRAACQLLREILILENASRLVLTSTNKGLHPVAGAGAAKSDEWSKLDANQLRQMARQAQSDKFQEAMQQLNGEHLYDTIRTQLIQAGGVWDATHDKHALQSKNIRPRSGSVDKNVKNDKNVKKEKHAQAPPPAPVNLKSTPTSQNKTTPTSTTKTQQVKNPIPAMNVSSGAIVSSARGGRANISKAN